MDLDLNLMRMLVAIVDSGTMSGAAKRLGVTRAQISRGVKALEKQFGAQLMRRTTRKLELTQQGMLVYQHARRGVQEMEVARYLVQQMISEPAGHVRVSVPTALGDLLLGRLLIDFAKRYDGITLGIRLSNRVTDLISNDVDVAVRVISEPPDGYVAKHISTIDWHLCASNQYLASVPKIRIPEDLASCEMLLPPSGKQQETLSFATANGVSHVRIATKIQSESFPFLAQAAIDGVGIVMLPSYFSNHLIKKNDLIRVLPDYKIIRPDNNLYILTTPTPYPLSANRAVVDFLAKKLADELENFK